MRVAALYDIHGNLAALDAVVGEVREAGADLIVVGGDVVPGPMPRETLTRLLQLAGAGPVPVPVTFILGNGEVAVLSELRGVDSGVPAPFREVVRWCAEQLREYEHVLAGWPKTVTIPIDGLGDVLFCHATPRNENEIFTRLTPEAALVPVFAGVTVPLVVCGHTHMQFDRVVGSTRVVNAGSVGMPFGQPGAYWLLLGGDVEPRRTSYDFREAAERIRATEYPQAEHFASRNVLQPPPEEEMLEVLARGGVK